MGRLISEQQGVQSIENALFILEAIKREYEPLTLTELSRKTSMSKSRLQKYLNSFIKLEVLSMNEKDKTYRLGPKLIELGLHTLNRADIISIVDPFMQKVKSELKQSSVLGIWTEKGPIIVKYQDSGRALNVKAEVGFYTPLLMSSVGKCFAAFLPKIITENLVNEELKTYGLKRDIVEKELEHIRNIGFTYRDKSFNDLPGTTSIASPIFDNTGNITASLCLIGFAGDLIPNKTSKEVIKLKSITRDISRLLGHSIKGRSD